MRVAGIGVRGLFGIFDHEIPLHSSNLQNAYDLEIADQKLWPQIEKEVLPRTAA